MDDEARLLLEVVAFGAGFGLFSIVRRRALSSLRFHAGVLAGLLTASLAALLVPSLRPLLAMPVIVSFGVFAIGPSLLIVAGRQRARGRGFRSASGLVWTGAALLGFPVPILRESQLYGALAASDRGATENALARMRRLVAVGGIPAAHGGRTLAEALPLAGARRWDEALAVIDASPSSATAVLAIEARAAAETGDLRRALRACAQLEGRAGADAAVAAARRAVLAAAGSVATLEQAVRERWPLLRGPRSAARLALGRAYEAAGDVAAARSHYGAAARRGPAPLRRDARVGLARLQAGASDTASPLDDTDELVSEVQRLERICRDDAARAPGAAAQRPWATWAASAVTGLISVAVILGPGADAFSLLEAGALSAPLVVNEGQWWRLLTAMLLHGGWLHLVLNLSCVIPIGVLVERRIGAARTLIVYVGSGLIGSLASVYLNGTQVGVGASGAAMGLIGALLVLLLRRPQLFDPAERRRWISLLWVGVAATGVIGLLESAYVDNAAHAAGLLGGMLVALPILPSRTRAEPALRRAGARVAAALLVGLTAVAVIEARAEAREWSTIRVVHARGASVAIPGWLRARPTADGAVLIERPPAEIALLLGAVPHSSPSPGALVPDDGPMRELLRRSGAAESLPDGTLVLPVTEADLDAGLGVEWESGVRFRVIRRGAAFVVVRLPADPFVESAYGRLLEQVRASLRATPDDREIDDAEAGNE